MHFSPTTSNYSKKSISLEEIKKIDMWAYLRAIGGEFIKEKSSRYGKLYKTDFGKLWVRYDYKTGYYFYVNLSDDSDKGTLIDFLQNNIIKERNLSKVKKYITDNSILFF